MSALAADAAPAALDLAPVAALRAEIDNPVFIQMLDYWLERCGDGRIPGRADIDPIDFPRALPSICLYDISRNPVRFKVRLCGTGIAAAAGRDITGEWIEQASEHFATDTEISSGYYYATETRLPHYRKGKLGSIRRDHFAVERLILPLAADGVHVDMILTSCFYFDGRMQRVAF